jgi:hypothetical protein
MAVSTPTPAEITDRNIAYDKANNPFYHQKRFEIQVHKNGERENIYLPTWQLVAIVLSTKKFNADDPKRPDRVIVSDNRDTYSRVLEWDRCWYGYETRLRRGAASGDEPRGWA